MFLLSRFRNLCPGSCTDCEKVTKMMLLWHPGTVTKPRLRGTPMIPGLMKSLPLQKSAGCLHVKVASRDHIVKRCAIRSALYTMTVPTVSAKVHQVAHFLGAPPPRQGSKPTSGCQSVCRVSSKSLSTQLTHRFKSSWLGNCSLTSVQDSHRGFQ